MPLNLPAICSRSMGKLPRNNARVLKLEATYASCLASEKDNMTLMELRRSLVLASTFLFFIFVMANTSILYGQSSADSLRAASRRSMKRAATFFRTNVASHGGYVYHHSLDLTRRWGEGEATRDQIWVQPPGTPTVGLAYLRAHVATDDMFYLDAAREAAEALVYGQVRSGGWTNCIDFNPRGKRVSQYRNGKGRGRNTSSFDDGQTATALRFLIRTDKALGFKNQSIHKAALFALDAVLRIQFPNGAFPQVWDDVANPKPKPLRASFPDYDWRTERRIKNYWDMYTINDNVPGTITETLIAAHDVYGDEKYMIAIERLGDFLILSQMPDPQPAWAQQYNYDMKPIWARKFEPPGVCGDESQEVIDTLMRIASITGNRKYLKPIPRALAYLKRSRLPNGQLARYYELRSNKPLYMRRRGKDYSLTYDDSNLPGHYGWKTDSRLDELTSRFNSLGGRGGSISPSSQQIRQIISQLDTHGRWVSTYNGEPLVGQLKLPSKTKYLASAVFADNLEQLADYLITRK